MLDKEDFQYLYLLKDRLLSMNKEPQHGKSDPSEETPPAGIHQSGSPPEDGRGQEPGPGDSYRSELLPPGTPLQDGPSHKVKPTKARLTRSSLKATRRDPFEIQANEYRSQAYASFMNRWRSMKELHRGEGTFVLGKKLPKAAAESLIREAAAILSSEYDITSIIPVIQEMDLTLRAFFRTLAQIRDDPDQDGEVRMEANDRIQQALLTFLRAYSTSSPNPVASQTYKESQNSIFGVLVNVNSAPVDEPIHAQVITGRGASSLTPLKAPPTECLPSPPMEDVNESPRES